MIIFSVVCLIGRDPLKKMWVLIGVAELRYGDFAHVGIGEGVLAGSFVDVAESDEFGGGLVCWVLIGDDLFSWFMCLLIVHELFDEFGVLKL